jgi:hypothetical protein
MKARLLLPRTVVLTAMLGAEVDKWMIYLLARYLKTECCHARFVEEGRLFGLTETVKSRRTAKTAAPDFLAEDWLTSFQKMENLSIRMSGRRLNTGTEE